MINPVSAPNPQQVASQATQAEDNNRRPNSAASQETSKADNQNDSKGRDTEVSQSNTQPALQAEQANNEATRNQQAAQQKSSNPPRPSNSSIDIRA